MKTIISWTGAITLALAVLAFAGVPQTINYQGYLKNTTTGAPASGSVNMTFSLYSTANGAGAVWSGSKSITPVNGVYSVELGANPQPVLPAFDRPYWLGIQAGMDPEMRPLQALTSVPYALSTPLQQSTVVTSSGNGFEVTNNGSGAAIKGTGSTGNYGTLGGANGVAGSSGDYYSGVLGLNSSGGAAVEGFSSGSGPAVYGHTTGTGYAGQFSIENAVNSSSALYVQTGGTGSAGRFYSSNPSASWSTLYAGSNGGNSALEAAQYGTGYGAYLSGSAPDNPFSVLYVDAKNSGIGVSVNASGTGMAASFSQSNSLSNALTLYTSNSGAGGVISGTSFGNGSTPVADFKVVNAAGAQNVLNAFTNGTGKAADLRITNSNNSSPVLSIAQSGKGNALDVVTTGADFNAGSFVVNNASNPYNALYAYTVGTGAAIQGNTVGTGSAGVFNVSISTNGSPALYAGTLGTGKAAEFIVNNGNSISPAVTIYQGGKGSGLDVSSPAVLNHAANIIVSNPSSSYNALYASHNGSGATVNIVNSGTSNAGRFSVTNAANNTPALYVNHAGSAPAVQGASISGWGVFGVSTGQYDGGVYGFASGASGAAPGVYGESNSPAGYGVLGVNLVSQNMGYLGVSSGGVYGTNPASGNYGFLGRADAGILGFSTGQVGIKGSSTNNVGVVGESTNNTGIWGIAGAGTGIDGVSSSGIGVLGRSTSGNGVKGTTGNNIALYGINNSAVYPAVEGWNQGTSDIFKGWSGGSPALKFYVTNAGNMWIAGTLAEASDLRLKTDIQPLDNALDKVERLRGVSYVMKDDPTQTTKIGVIAQELEQEYPELVTTDEKGMKSVAYANLTAVLIEAVKGLKAENDALKADQLTMKRCLERLEQLFDGK